MHEADCLVILCKNGKCYQSIFVVFVFEQKLSDLGNVFLSGDKLSTVLKWDNDFSGNLTGEGGRGIMYCVTLTGI